MSKSNTSIIHPREREALKKFRTRIPDILENFNEYKSHDLWLLRWLRARELDIDKSEDMLRTHLAWRIKENIGNINDFEIPEAINQRFHMQASGFDKSGCTVGVVQFGKWDMRKIISLGFKEEFIRSVDLAFEQLMTFIELRSTPDSMITQFNVIVDLEGFNLGQVTSRETIECILEIVRHFEANHPETLKVGWIVNAPKIFEILFNIIKPLLTARTISKIQVYGSNAEQWKRVLMESIEPDQLTSQMGGTNTSCKIYKIGDGFDVFQVYEVFPETDFLSVTLEAGVKHTVSHTLRKGNKLSWNFRTADYDIGFLLVFSYFNEEMNSTSSNCKSESGETESTVVFETSRADSHINLQKGAFVADLPGTYSLLSF